MFLGLWPGGESHRTVSDQQVITKRRTQYLEYLESDHWRQLRISKLNLNGRICEACASTKILHVHHVRYLEFYDCTEQDLVVLCKTCHDDFHLASKVMKFDYINLGIEQIKHWLATARVNERFIKRKERRTRRINKKAARLPSYLVPGSLRKNRRKLLKDGYRAARADQYSNASLKAFAELLLSIIATPEPIKAVPTTVRQTTVTPDLLESLKSSPRGWSREVLASVGVPWPPPRGWRKRLLREWNSRDVNVEKFGH